MAESKIFSESEDPDTKARAYAMSEEYMNRFIGRNGSVVCRELLGYDLSKPDEKCRCSFDHILSGS